MRPPRLAEAAHQRGVARPRGRSAPGSSRGIFRSCRKIFGNDDRKSAFADVDDDRDLLDVAAGAQRQLRQRRNQRRRQVVDAEVAEILERADRLRLARAGQPGEDDERLRRACARGARAAAWRGASPRSAARARRSSPAPPGSTSSSSLVGRRRRRVCAACCSSRVGERRAPRDGRARAAADCAPRPRRGSRCCGPGATGMRISGTRRPEDLVELVVEPEPLVLARADPSARAARPARRASTSASRRCRTGP